VRAIAVADVLRVLEPVWTSKTETASRLRGRIEQVLAWATVAGHREGDNPARWRGNLDQLLPKPSKVADSGNQPALSLRDAPRWWAALREREGMAARALEFLALTAARSGEVRGMTWDEVTMEGGEAIWTIPAVRMKMGKTHRVPLSAQALDLLQKLPRLDGSPYVFFAPKGGPLSDMALSAVMRRLQEADVRAGGVGYLDTENKRPAVPHGLRSTFRQWAAEQGFPSDMAEIALAHARDSEVERAYQRSDLIERRRAMMAAWAGYLAREDRQGNVIRLDKSAV
jgi:integrase